MVVVVVILCLCTCLCVWGYVFGYALPSVVSSFAIILTRKRESVALLKLHSWCLMTVSVLWPFLAVPWVGLQWVILVFPDHIQILNYHMISRLVVK